jgi:predicted aconitase with swiveling domain
MNLSGPEVPGPETPGPEAPGPQLHGRTLHPGRATGSVLRLTEPVSFWGGVGEDGRIVDVHHPQRGTSLAGQVVVMDVGRGSSSSATVVAELVRAAAAPAALVLGECDSILVVGALVAAELYGVQLPLVQLEAEELDRLSGQVTVAADPSGSAQVTITATGEVVR